MKKFIFLLFIFTITLFSSIDGVKELPNSSCDTYADDEKQIIVDKISKLIATPLNTIFFNGAKKINKSYIEKYNIKAIEIFDTELNEIFLTSYMDKNNVVHKMDKISKDMIKNTISYTSNIYNTNQSKKIGSLTVYFNYSKKFEKIKFEKLYKDTDKTINICTLSNYLPYSGMDDDKFTGISLDLLNKFFKNQKIKYNFIPIENIDKKKCDIFPFAIKDIDKKNNLNFTKTYDTEPLVITTLYDKDFINNLNILKYKKIAVIDDDIIVHKIESKYPYITIIRVKNPKDGLNSVVDRDVFGYIDLLSTTNYNLKKYNFNDLKISAMMNIYVNIRMASICNKPILNDFLNHSIENTNITSFKKIYKKYTEIKVNKGINYRYIIYIIFILILLFLILKMKKMKKELSYEKNEKDLIFDKTLNGIIIFEKGICVDINNSGINILGYHSKYEMIDRSFYNFTKEKTLEKKSKPYETLLLKKDTVEFPALVQEFDFKDEEKSFRMISFIDLTDKNRSIEEEKLKVKDATKIKTEFLSNMSHEIRTPMNGIIGMNHLISKTRLTKKQKNYIQKIDNSAKSLLSIINDILDFSRMEAKEFSIEKIDFDIFKMVDDVVDLIKFQVEEKNLEFIVEYDSNIGRYFHGDSLRLSQVLNNLLSNAVKFTQKGTITLKIKKIFGNKFRFSVEDTGIGLSYKEQSKLFKSFTQADGTNSREHGGVGLGLSISKELIKLMNGSIWVNSEEKKGSKFIFEIELQERENSNNFNIYKDKKVLIIDSNKQWHKALKNILIMFGMQVEHVYTTDESIKRLYECKTVYDLILIDFNMSGIVGVDGMQVAKQIDDMCMSCISHGNCEFKLPPKVIMVNTLEKEIIAKDAKEIGINTLLQKPVSPLILDELLSDIFIKQDFSGKETLQNNISDLAGNKILLVDDNHINQEIVLGLLENSSISIDVANNGKEALEKFKENSYELIFMDIQMPTMDGYEATKHIREIDKDIPIIALSANVMKEDIEKSKKVGMNEHLKKPIDVEKLYDVLLRYLSSKVDKKLYIDDNEKIPNFEHLDSFIGLSHMAGNKKLYFNILNDFKTKYRDLGLYTLDGDEFQRVIHTIKGLSATIGAVKLNEITKKIDNIDKKEHIENFYEELKKVFKDIDRLLISDEKTTQKELDNQKQDELLEKLKSYAKRHRSRGCKDILNNLEICDYNKDKSFLDNIRELIKERRYDEIMEVIDAEQNNTYS